MLRIDELSFWEKSSYFENIQAYKNNNLLDMVCIAQSLGIKIPNFKDEKLYKKAIDTLNKNKNNITNSVAWLWFENPVKRELLRTQLATSWNVSIIQIKNIETEFGM